MIEIDGAIGEGGGQIIRTSVALAAICQVPVRLTNIRAKRSKPGLQRQHLMAVRAAGQISSAELDGDEVGSPELIFRPTRKVSAGEYRFEIGTAGACGLVLQTVLVPLALAGGRSTVTVTGGTHNPMAPPAEYLEFVYLPALSGAGLEWSFDCPRHGFYPKGGGEITASFELPRPFTPVEYTIRGGTREAAGVVISSSLPETVGERGERALREFVPEDWPVLRRDKPSLGAGAAVFAYTQFEGGYGGFTGLGERGKPMEKVAEECGSSVEKWLALDAPIDEHLADQLVLPMCFAEGSSRWRTHQVTDHLRTVLEIVTAFLPVSNEIEEFPDGSGIVRLDGIGPVP